MKLPRIKFSRSTGLTLKADAKPPNAAASPAAYASQAVPSPSLPQPQMAGFPPTSRCRINEPHLAPADVSIIRPPTAKPTNARAPLGIVRFELFASAARAVFLAGAFNDWNPTSTPMTRCAEGKWVKELSLPPGRYQYRFVADGQWMDDPKAKDYIPNPFGGFNSVVQVEEPAGACSPFSIPTHP